MIREDSYNHLYSIHMMKLTSQKKYIQNVSIVLRSYKHKYFPNVIKSLFYKNFNLTKKERPLSKH